MIAQSGRIFMQGALLACFAALCPVGLPAASIVDANPSNYRTLLRRLGPGDTLRLGAGSYSRLPIAQLNGTDEAWITITGPADGAPAIVTTDSDRNVIDLYNSSYVAIQNLRIDSRGIPGAFGIAAHGSEENLVHHIRVEGNTFTGQGGNQQTVAISTKTPTWGWEIRYNRILGAGTGIYLGHSNDTQPFVAGLIEHNLIRDTIGYNLEIKGQKILLPLEGMPLEPTSTVIRNNVFIKNDRPSPDGDRPNVLVSSFPATGHGSLNMYEIYGNVFLHNHREALLQASGRVTIHDNIFVDGPYAYPALLLRHHNGNPVQVAYVYHNTVYTSGGGVQFGSRATVDDAVVGNVVFASTPISGQILRQADNLTGLPDEARQHLTSPSFDLESMDFFPVPGKCLGRMLNLSPFYTDTDYTRDFNGRPKTRASGAVQFRGAYAGSGPNPGWKIQAELKPPPPPSPDASPVLVWVDPPGVPAGRTVQVQLTGAGFEPDATVVGDGVTVTKAAFSGPARITATVAVNEGSVPAGRKLKVRQKSGESNSVNLTIAVPRR